MVPVTNLRFSILWRLGLLWALVAVGQIGSTAVLRSSASVWAKKKGGTSPSPPTSDVDEAGDPAAPVQESILTNSADAYVTLRRTWTLHVVASAIISALATAALLASVYYYHSPATRKAAVDAIFVKFGTVPAYRFWRAVGARFLSVVAFVVAFGALLVPPLAGTTVPTAAKDQVPWLALQIVLASACVAIFLFWTVARPSTAVAISSLLLFGACAAVLMTVFKWITRPPTKAMTQRVDEDPA
jgi:hypothetical protein